MRQNAWDWRAAGNFAGGGTGSGLAACTAASAAFVEPPAGQFACALAAIAIAAGLALVAQEMGRPLRFFRVILHPQTSWMTREALVAPPLLLALIAAALTGRRDVMIAAGILGLALLYVQAQMVFASRGIPAWSRTQIVPLFIASGLVEGMGLLLFITSVVSRVSAAYVIAFVLLVVMRWICWKQYYAATAGRAPASAAALESLDRTFRVDGVVIPIALLALSFLIVLQPLAALAGLAALASGWRMKIGIITQASHTVGFSLPKVTA